MWRLDEVDQFAQQDVLAREFEGRGTDPIDIVLAYRLGLREQLELPVLTSGMTFRTLARRGSAIGAGAELGAGQ